MNKMMTFSLPLSTGRAIEKLAKEESQTISEFLKESLRQYRALRNLKKLAQLGHRTIKVRKLTTVDFGGPFEE